MVIGTYILIINLNVNGLNAPFNRLAEWIQKQDIDWLNGYKNKTIYMLSTRDPLQT